MSSSAVFRGKPPVPPEQQAWSGITLQEAAALILSAWDRYSETRIAYLLGDSEPLAPLQWAPFLQTIRDCGWCIRHSLGCQGLDLLERAVLALARCSCERHTLQHCMRKALSGLGPNQNPRDLRNPLPGESDGSDVIIEILEQDYRRHCRQVEHLGKSDPARCYRGLCSAKVHSTISAMPSVHSALRTQRQVSDLCSALAKEGILLRTPGRGQGWRLSYRPRWVN